MRISNAGTRDKWIRETLAKINPGGEILDVGAGSCQYKKYCNHLVYKSQDVAQYDGVGNCKGLHIDDADYANLDFVCDLYDIPDTHQYDAVLCTEVIEHVTDPVKAIAKLCTLTAPGGTLILTAPFCSLTHYAPHHYATGFSEYFYRHHLLSNGLEIESLEPNGGYFDYLSQEIGRVGKVFQTYHDRKIDFASRACLQVARFALDQLAAKDGSRMSRKSSELLIFGWHVKAKKPEA